MLEQGAIDRLAATLVTPRANVVGGRQDRGEASLDVISPIDGKPFTTIADSSAAEVDHAVGAARLAFETGPWSQAPALRKKVLLRLAELIEEHALELAVLGVRDNGTEINMAYKAEPLSAATSFRYYAEAIDKVYDQIAPTAPDILALVHREPLGVVGAIVPDTLILGPDPSQLEGEFGRDPETGELKVDAGMAWLTDFGKAVEVGMAVRIPLPDPWHRTGFDRVVVLGLRLSSDEFESKQLVEDLLNDQ
ncbi:MAG: aldehyde dehydrogenase family protein, partial [Devosia sp.]